ncbi:HD domain-containing protein [Kocuria tytonicola]|uniref:HD domain-containing protein n=1 Tax=Kocuria tytonicola TaxID=2055946 RepID=A0A3L9L660_9MICC|nr:HD domain-containing protein [Kocuria tytonicola]RLY94290.1 HD domain-containing protein [Kocuria tytonicola]
MSTLTDRARDIATRAHHGQTDKTGADYIDHPRRVAERVRHHAAAEQLEAAQVVAWLHDVVEDTPVTLDDLRAEFPADIVAGVDAMTRRPDEEHDDYYRRVAADPLARVVKQADLDDNTDPARTALLDPETRARLEQKYAHAREVLAAG